VKHISILGVGNMGSAMVRGLISSNKAIPEMVTICDLAPDKTERLKAELGVKAAGTPRELVSHETDILILAVKPQSMKDAIALLADSLHERLVIISIAAGLSTDFILSCIGKPARVIRAMPNAAAMALEGATALCKAGLADQNDLNDAIGVFSAVGTVVTVDEKMMHVVTALSGSAPGYMFVMMEAFTDGAVLMGLDRPTARALTVQTFLGAAKMAMEPAAFSDLKDRITSPGGTTIAGLQVMENAGIRGILMDTVEAATRRGQELDAK
jgi:pyrroline-5-carboxylate reductase